MSDFIDGEGEGKQSVFVTHSDKGRKYVVTVEQDYYRYDLTTLMTYRHGLTGRAWTLRGSKRKVASLRRRVRDDIRSGKAQTMVY